MQKRKILPILFLTITSIFIGCGKKDDAPATARVVFHDGTAEAFDSEAEKILNVDNMAFVDGNMEWNKEYIPPVDVNGVITADNLNAVFPDLNNTAVRITGNKPYVILAGTKDDTVWMAMHITDNSDIVFELYEKGNEGYIRYITTENGSPVEHFQKTTLTANSASAIDVLATFGADYRNISSVEYAGDQNYNGEEYYTYSIDEEGSLLYVDQKIGRCEYLSSISGADNDKQLLYEYFEITKFELPAWCNKAEEIDETTFQDEIDGAYMTMIMAGTGM